MSTREMTTAFQIGAIPTLMDPRRNPAFREAAALAAAALKKLLTRVAEVDMDDVRKKLAKAEATNPKTATL